MPGSHSPESHDTTLVNQLHDSIKENINSFDKAFQFAEQCLEISGQIDYEWGTAETNTYLGKIYFHNGELDSALIYFNRSLIQFKNLKDIGKTIALHNYIGVTHYQYEDYKRAIVVFKKGLHLSDSIANLKMIANFSNKLGACYEELGYYTKSTNILIKALEASRTSGDKQEEAHILNNIGIIFLNLDNHEKAKAYFQQAQLIFSDLDDKHGLSDIANNFGDLYYREGYYKKAIEYFEMALGFSKELEDDFGVALILNNIGGCYLRLDNFELTVEYLEKANRLATEIGFHEIIASSLANLGNINLNNNNYLTAIGYGEKSLMVAKEINAISDELIAHELLYKAYSKTSNYKEAFRCLENHQIIHDSINLVQQNNQIHEIEAKYEAKNKEQEIAMLTEGKKADELIQNYLTGIIFIGGFLLFALLILYNNIKRTKRVLEKSEDDLILANNTKEKILSIIGHDMLSPIGTNKEFTDLILKETNSLSKEDIINILTPLKPALDATYYMAENLLYWGRSQRNKIGYSPRTKPIKPIVDSCITLFEFQTNTKAITFQFKGDETTKAFFDMDQIIIVIRNLISNAIKFSKENSIITISLSAKNNYAFVSIIDSGIGIPKDDLAVLFNQDSKLKSRYGTNYEKGTGLGLVIVKDFVEKNNGQIWVESQEGKGSKFSFTLPLVKDTK